MSKLRWVVIFFIAFVYFILLFFLSAEQWFVLLFFLNLTVIHLGYGWGAKFGLTLAGIGDALSLLGILFKTDLWAVGVFQFVLFSLTGYMNYLFLLRRIKIRTRSAQQFNPMRNAYRTVKKKNRYVKKKRGLLEREIENITTLYQFSRQVASSLKLEEIIRTAADLLSKALELKNIAIFLWDSDRREFKKVFEEGFPVAPSAVFKDLEKTDKNAIIAEGHGGYKLLLPLIIEEKLIGWIGSYDRENSFQRFIEEGTILADQIALGIEKARLYKRVEEMSRMDSLTQLYRYHYFMKLFQQEILRAQRYRTKFSFIMIDVDHFKQYNDTYGHPVGDELLKGLSRIIKESAYETDIVARYGGEEFALVMPMVNPSEARIKAEKIRQAVSSYDFQVGNKQFKLSISLGLSHFPSHTRNPELLIQYADKALYRAKEQGRNQVVEYSIENSQ